MAIEKTPIQMTEAEIDAARLEAVRRRVVAWDISATTMHDLVKEIANLSTEKHSVEANKSFNQTAQSVVLHCEQISTAVDVAAASVSVAQRERAELAAETARLEQDICKEEQSVGHLRKVLERERRQVDRRLQYESLAKIIIAEPSADISQQHLDKAQSEYEAVERDFKLIEQQRELLAKEFQLLLNCSANLSQLAVALPSALKDEGASMDTSA